MAGGKETPRQKMIGMMYLVLTALLALNVSKQIVSAFITINNKLDKSAEILDIKSSDAYGEIDKKRAAIVALDGDVSEIDFWQQKAAQLKDETTNLVDFLLGESNEMIESSEGEDWIEEKDENGRILSLKSLDEIQGMDNYDIPTNLFVGSNPQKPNERGYKLIETIHKYRNRVTELMGNYEKAGVKYTFEAPESIDGLAEALKTANEEDTTEIRQMYQSLTIPEQIYAHGEDKLLPWQSVTFDHAPIVAAAAMFTSLKLDIKNAEAMAAKYMVDKIDAPIFDFNKIDPMPIAPTSYINQGDSLPFKVMIAAYDTNDIAPLKWGMDTDTLAENWKETEGGFYLSGNQPGPHKVKGVIGVMERGQRKWKPWEFNYTVGQPMGVVAQPKMRILYWGYDNEVEATASGFPSERVKMRGNGCSIVKEGNRYLAKVQRGTRSASIDVIASNEDGSTVNLGRYEFKCAPLPDPDVKVNGVEDGSEISYTQARNLKQVTTGYGPDILLTDANFKIKGGELIIPEIPGPDGKILPGGRIDDKGQRSLTQSKGKYVTFEIEYEDPSGKKDKKSITVKVKN